VAGGLFGAASLSTREPAEPEVALKLSGYLGNWDAAIFASRGYYRAPAPLNNVAVNNVARNDVARNKVSGTMGEYPRLNTLGASLSGPLAGGVLNLETGFYHSVDDPGGDNPVIENGQLRFLVGYSRQLGKETQIGVQAYAEWMQDYNDYKRNLSGVSVPREQLRTVATMRFTQQYLYQALTLNLFAYWGAAENDSYVIPSLRYAFNDYLWAEVGANIFSGSRRGMFGTLADNDNIYLTVRCSF
tara:strand:+ start:143 stop:874 length:732 start_codon:yes stop_codon:yes gene_type:complete